MKHLTNNKRIFEILIEKVQACDHKLIDELRAQRDHEELSMYITNILCA